MPTYMYAGGGGSLRPPPPPPKKKKKGYEWAEREWLNMDINTQQEYIWHS